MGHDNPRGHTPPESMLTLSEAASYLGIRSDSLRRLADMRRVPCVRGRHAATPAGIRLFTTQDLDAYRQSTIAYHEARIMALRQKSIENGEAA